MAMAYGRTAKVSDAAKKIIGPDDPKARAEVEAKRNQEFDVWDQIGMTADMLPGGAIAAGGAKAAKNLAEAAIRAYDKAPSPAAGSTFYTGMQEAMKVVARISKGSKNLLEDAIKLIDETLAKQEKGAEAENAFLSAKKAIEAVLDGTFDLARKKKGAKHREALSQIKEEKKPPLLLGQDLLKESKALNIGDTSDFSALELVKDLQAKAKIPKATEEIMATKDLPASTRMSRDMPPPSGRNRVDQSGLEGLSFNVEDISSMTDDQVKYWIELESNMKPMDASTTQRQNEKLSLLMQEAKKRGLR
jgi:hypothetical protein